MTQFDLAARLNSEILASENVQDIHQQMARDYSAKKFVSLQVCMSEFEQFARKEAAIIRCHKIINANPDF